MKNTNKQFAGGAVLSYITIAFNVVSGLLYTPWMIRTIGDDQYALYTLALSVINLFLIDFGITSAVAKFLSAYYADKDYDKAEKFMGIVYKIFLFIAAVIFLCLFVFYFLLDGIYVKLTPSELTVFKRLFIIVSVYSVFSFPALTFNSVLMANEKFIDVKICNLLNKVLSVALIIVCLLCNYGVYSLVLVHAFVNFFIIGLKYYFVRRHTKQRGDFKSWDKGIAKNIFTFTSWITVRDFAQRCIFTIMPTIIAAVIGSKEITIFSLAATLEGYVFTFADAINGMFMPKISKIVRKENANQQIQQLMTTVGKFHIFTIGLIFIGFVCVGKTFIHLWVGEQYNLVYISTIILLLPSIVDVPQQVAKTTLTVKDIVKEQSIVFVIMAVINVILSVVFLHFFGIVGATIAICIAYFIRTLGLNLLYRMHLQINLRRYFISVYAKWIIIAAATLGASYLFSAWVQLSGFWNLILNGFFVVAVYGILYVVFHAKAIKSKFASMRA